MTTSREAFEKWVLEPNQDGGVDRWPEGRPLYGAYKFTRVQAAWDGWQGALAAVKAGGPKFFYHTITGVEEGPLYKLPVDVTNDKIGVGGTAVVSTTQTSVAEVIGSNSNGRDVQTIAIAHGSPLLPKGTQLFTCRTGADTRGVDEALEIAVRYGGIDGSHHKDWVIDQIVRALAGNRYEEIVARARNGEDGPDTYDWEEGIPP
jgi:hypothetical protein